MTQSRALLVLSLALTVLPACGGGDDKPAAAKTTAPPTVEPREYALALADPAESLRETYTAWERDCSDGIALACGLGPIGLSANAETLVISLDLATREGHADYVGRLAPKDQPLLDDTVADAEAMKVAAGKLMDAEYFDLAGWAKHA